MTILNRLTKTAALAAALALGVLAAHPAQAQTHIVRRTVITTHYTVRGPLTPGQREAQRLHRQAVKLDHQATYADQHGNRKLGGQLAQEASDLNARAYRAAHH
jgi:ABC-type sugar transport system substrate-binding protein